MRSYRCLVLVGAIALTACAGGDKDEPAEPMEDKEAAEPEAAMPAEPAPEPAPAPEAAPAPAPAPAAAAEPAGFDGAKVSRFVTTVALKIHTQPAKESPVVGWVKKGDKVDVVLNGEWAKLDHDKYISAKFLSETPVVAGSKPTKKAKK